jgi:hypothetical protein
VGTQVPLPVVPTLVFERSAVCVFWNNFVRHSDTAASYVVIDITPCCPQLEDVDGGINSVAELRAVKHEIYVEELLKKQGVSDERRKELKLQRQQPPQQQQPPPQEPQLTLEDVQRQIAAHRLRHLAMDRAYAQPKQRQRKKNKATVTVASGEKLEDI